MFAKNLVTAFVLGATAICIAQTPSVTPVKTSVQHYRLTFVLTNSPGKTSPQNFSIDVPVAPGRPGASRITLVSGLPDDAQTVVQRTIACTDVHTSAAGLALSIAMESDSEAPAIAGVSARHRHGVFQRRVDLALGKPTVVTNAMHLIPLGKTDPATAAAIAGPAPQITVTATEL